MYAGYEENEIGALDCEEIEGYVPETSDILLQYAEEFKKSQEREQMDKDTVTTKIKEQVDRESGDEDEEEEFTTIPVQEKEKWDCESILSTYSNLYNHPKLITEAKKKEKIIIDKRTGIPKNVFESKKLSAKALNVLNEQNHISDTKGPASIGGESIISQLSVLSIRPKDETPEEKRERKKNLKEYRRERRLEKKLNKVAFVEEAKRQAKISINNKNNVQGNRIL